MNKPELTEVRRSLDQAITYADFTKAKKLAQQGLKIARKHEYVGEIMYFKAQQEILGEDYPQAMKYLDLAIKYNPSDGAALNDLGLCMIELGFFDEAAEYFEKGIEVEPDFATIYHNKGWLLCKQGKMREAIECFQKALEIDPDRAVTYENLGHVYEKLSRRKDAISAYKNARDFMQNDNPDIKGQIMAHIKRLEKHSSN